MQGLNLAGISETADLILDQCSYCIGELIQIADTGEISSVDGMGCRYIVIISGKNTDHSDSAVLQ